MKSTFQVVPLFETPQKLIILAIEEARRASLVEYLKVTQEDFQSAGEMLSPVGPKFERCAAIREVKFYHGRLKEKTLARHGEVKAREVIAKRALRIISRKYRDEWHHQRPVHLVRAAKVEMGYVDDDFIRGLKRVVVRLHCWVG